MMSNRKPLRMGLVVVLCAALALAMLPMAVRADERMGGASYVISDQSGAALFSFGGQVFVGDEYISGDNKRYRVSQVDDNTATGIAEFIENVVLWDTQVEPLRSVSAPQNKPKIALYCTHTAESYEKGDGTESKEENGGIVDVAKELATHLEQHGCEAVVNDENHVPHDAGAYRRSRRTATSLMKEEQPDMLLDIHRDGVPDAEEYTFDVDGEPCSKVRIVVGRSNSNRQANEDTAKKIKKVADENYKGLIKDIFIGRGTYNQDLMPNAILLEFGTHTINKDKVLKSTEFMGDVLAQTIGATGKAEKDDERDDNDNNAAPNPGQQNNQDRRGEQQSQQMPAADKGQKSAAASGIAWTLGILLAVGLIFLLVTTAGGRRGERVKHFFKELSGTGKKPDDH